MKKIGYKHTVAASFTAFVVQAVVNNFAPLLFLTFQAQYGIELSKITVLITANFFIQIFVKRDRSFVRKFFISSGIYIIGIKPFETFL